MQVIEVPPRFIVGILQTCPITMYRLSTMCGLTQVSLRRYVNETSVPGEHASKVLTSFFKLQSFLESDSVNENVAYVDAKEFGAAYWKWVEENRISFSARAALLDGYLGDGEIAKARDEGMEEYLQIDDPRLDELSQVQRELSAAYQLINEQHTIIENLRKKIADLWESYSKGFTVQLTKNK